MIEHFLSPKFVDGYFLEKFFAAFGFCVRDNIFHKSASYYKIVMNVNSQFFQTDYFLQHEDIIVRWRRLVRNLPDLNYESVCIRQRFFGTTGE